MNTATVYEVWDHAWLGDIPASIEERSTTLDFGYWILELDQPAKVTGFYRHTRPFRWEHRDGPYLTPRDAYAEQDRPSLAISFADFPRLQFGRSLEVIVELQRMRDREFGERTPDDVYASDSDSIEEQVDSVERAFAEFLSWEFWDLKYRVTHEYCRSLRPFWQRFR